MKDELVTLWIWGFSPKYLGLFRVVTRDPHIRLEAVYRESLGELLADMCRLGCRFVICHLPSCHDRQFEFCSDRAWPGIWKIRGVFLPAIPGVLLIDTMSIVMHLVAHVHYLSEFDYIEWATPGPRPEYSLITTRNIPPGGIDENKLKAS